jgi:hypothetical protein
VSAPARRRRPDDAPSVPPRLAAIVLAPAMLAVVLVLVLAPAPADATDGNVVTGAHDTDGILWHSHPQIQVAWDPNPAGSGSEIYFAVRGWRGEPLPGYEGQASGGFPRRTLVVPSVPGAYTLQLAELHADGTPGPSTYAPLFFDDARPAPVSIAAPAWVAAGTVVPIHLGHPAEPVPLSGIQGYAVSIDGAAAGSPCSDAERCAADEIELRGGAGADSIALPAPPEGISYIHAVAVSGSGMSSPTDSALLGVDGTPPQVRLEGAPAGWAAGPVRLRAFAIDPLSGMAPAGAGGPVTAIGVDGGPPLVSAGATAEATVTGQGTHQVIFWGRDAVGNAGDGSLPFAKPATATIRIDETDPTVRFVAGDPGDPERIEATVADSLAGLDPGRGGIALRRVGSSGPFRPLPTEVGRGRLVARWNSDDYPHGAYEFRAVGFDTAGNSAATTAAPDGGPFVLEDPVKREAHLAIGFGGRQLVYQRCARADGARRCRRTVVRSYARRPVTRAVPCCHAAVVGGRLLDATGAPLPGQAIDVVETFAHGARHATRRTAATTDADGEFRARLAPGPSRAVSVEFTGTHLLTRAAGRSLRLRVRAGVHLRVSTTRVRVGGAPVVFKGRVVHPEAQIPATGLPVELEFRLPGMAWSEFRTLQTDSSGHFAYPYAFSDDDSAGVRFLFRAFVPATGNWPFAPATSRPLAVTG